MKALIFAAGRGVRMLPLTLTTPKPLLQVHGKALIVYQIERLVRAGISDLVINIAHLGAQIREALGSGSAFGAHIAYSDEGSEPLETAGGIRHALPLLGSEAFAAVNADILCDYDYTHLRDPRPALAHLVLVNNPGHNARGDFALERGRCSEHGARLTFSGIGVYQPELFRCHEPDASKLASVLRSAIAAKQVSGEHYPGSWVDVGTPERLRELNR